MAILTKKQFELDNKLHKKAVVILNKLLDVLTRLNNECCNQSAIELAEIGVRLLNMLKDAAIKESKENGTYRIWFDNPSMG